jgi:hypothetical protein
VGAVGQRRQGQKASLELPLQQTNVPQSKTEEHMFMDEEHKLYSSGNRGTTGNRQMFNQKVEVVRARHSVE